MTVHFHNLSSLHYEVARNRHYVGKISAAIVEDHTVIIIGNIENFRHDELLKLGLKMTRDSNPDFPTIDPK